MQAVYNSDYEPLLKLGGWVFTKISKSKNRNFAYHLYHATISPTALHKSPSNNPSTLFLTIHHHPYLSHKQYPMSSFLTHPIIFPYIISHQFYLPHPLGFHPNPTFLFYIIPLFSNFMCSFLIHSHFLLIFQ